LWVEKVTGDTETIYCGGAWVGGFLDIESVLDRSLPSKNVVFLQVKQGNIFNFLNQDFPRSSIEELQFLEIARLRSIFADPFEENNRSPNFCNSNYGTVESTQVMIVHLPYGHEELDDPAY
jgi:hypothetical protein